MRIGKYLALEEIAGIINFPMYDKILTCEQAIDPNCRNVSLRRLMEICKFAATRQSEIAPQLRLAARHKKMACLLIEQNAEWFLTVIHEMYPPTLPPNPWPGPGPFDDSGWYEQGMDEDFGDWNQDG
jgi:hypothetical protein